MRTGEAYLGNLDPVLDKGVKVFFLESSIIFIDQIFKGFNLKLVGQSYATEFIDANSTNFLCVLIQIG
jgi:hypothetical protein